MYSTELPYYVNTTWGWGLNHPFLPYMCTKVSHLERISLYNPRHKLVLLSPHTSLSLSALNQSLNHSLHLALLFSLSPSLLKLQLDKYVTTVISTCNLRRERDIIISHVWLWTSLSESHTCHVNGQFWMTYIHHSVLF